MAVLISAYQPFFIRMSNALKRATSKSEVALYLNLQDLQRCREFHSHRIDKVHTDCDL